MKKLKVAVGLSGGVDSAVSAYLLKKQGFDISGVYLHCFDDDAPGCRGKQDRQDALKVAVHLKIPFRVLDFRRQYKSAVIAYFKKEYLAGRTPNPDVVCNRDIKFGLLLDWCVKNGFDYLATGHYAKLIRKSQLASAKSAKIGLQKRSDKSDSDLSDLSIIRSGPPQAGQADVSRSRLIFLARPKDEHKDQTYFLWAVPRQNFSRVLFPLADFRKKDVRSVAKFAKIPVADKPDSTGICFIGEVRVEDFLKRLGVKEKAGEVVTRVCGEYPENGCTAETVKTAKISNRSAVQPFSRSDRLPPQSHRHTDSCYRIIGSHRGVWFYTIGQRHGFEITRWPPCHPELDSSAHPSLSSGFGRNDGAADRPPLYVISKDVRRNRLIVGFGPECYRDQFEVRDCNWLAEERIITSFFLQPLALGPWPLFVRIRHLGDLIPCSVIGSPFSVFSSESAGFQSSGQKPINRKLITVFLAVPQRGLAPGQSAVFYSKEGTVLGGGIIQ